MRFLKYLFFFIFSFASLSTTLGQDGKNNSTTASAVAKTVVHKLRVAAHPTLGYNNSQIDLILNEMSAIANKSWFSWDANCNPIQFTRDGDIFSSNEVPLTGEHKQISSAVKAIAPNVNAIIVSHLFCGTIDAAGCGYVGAEPLIVIPYAGFDGILWLHERGHNMGLPHAQNEGAEESTQPENIGKRVMFWRLGQRHYGKTNHECNTWRRSGKFSSVAEATIIDTQVTAAAEKESDAPKYGLTKRAYNVIGPPWIEGNEPTQEIDQLDANDLNSIRQMLGTGIPNETWPNAFKVISKKGTIADADYMKKLLEEPLASPAGQQTDLMASQKRAALRAKFLAPDALATLANRTHDQSIILFLSEMTNVNKSAQINGPALANEISTLAVRSLAKIDSQVAATRVKEILDAQALPITTKGPMVRDVLVPSLSSNLKSQVMELHNVQRNKLQQ